MPLIDTDDEGTWPSDLLSRLVELQNGITEFQVERLRMQQAANDDERLRFRSTQNQHQPNWDAALDAVKSSVVGWRMVGYHATRLTNAEVVSVQTSGLRILSAQ